jgi:signal peptidase II
MRVSGDIEVARARWLALSALIVLLDQWTKSIATGALSLGDPVAVAPGFNLTLAHNLGIAFSMFNDGSGWQRYGLSGFALVVSVLMVLWLLRLTRDEWLSALGLALVIGGALGNVIDRVRLGYVVDFIEVYAGTHYWPAFNVADSAICVGAGLLLLAGFRHERKPSAKIPS